MGEVQRGYFRGSMDKTICQDLRLDWEDRQ